MAIAHYEGETARGIEAFTKATMKTALADGLAERGRVIGENDLVLLQSAVAAEKRLKESKPFVLMLVQPAVSAGCRVRGDDGLAHSGMKYDWSFLFQLSESRIDGKLTNEQIVAADSDLNDIVRSIFIERYGFFRDIGFTNLRVDPREETTDRTKILNPLVVRFYNKIRLPVDTFLTV